MIPKIFHTIWLGDKPMPERWRHCWESWKDYHPSWDWCLWTDGLAARAVAEQMPVSPFELPGEFDARRASDVLRYELLWLFGGVYVDVDFECFRPIDSLLESVSLFAAREGPQDIAIGILGATRQNPAFRTILNDLPASIERYQDLGDQTGPSFFARELRERSLPFTIFPPEIFYPYRGDEAREGVPFNPASHPEAYAAHYWASIAAPSLVW
jgi:inositol phosphorylceramide mannosyltransferase catalytic subunit